MMRSYNKTRRLNLTAFIAVLVSMPYVRACTVVYDTTTFSQPVSVFLLKDGRPAMFYKRSQLGVQSSLGTFFCVSSDVNGTVWMPEHHVMIERKQVVGDTLPIQMADGRPAVVFHTIDGLLNFKAAEDQSGLKWGSAIVIDDSMSGISRFFFSVQLEDLRPAVLYVRGIAYKHKKEIIFTAAIDVNGTKWPKENRVVLSSFYSDDFDIPSSIILLSDGRPVFSFQRMQVNRSELWCAISDNVQGTKWPSENQILVYPNNGAGTIESNLRLLADRRPAIVFSSGLLYFVVSKDETGMEWLPVLQIRGHNQSPQLF